MWSSFQRAPCKRVTSPGYVASLRAYSSCVVVNLLPWNGLKACIVCLIILTQFVWPRTSPHLSTACNNTYFLRVHCTQSNVVNCRKNTCVCLDWPPLIYSCFATNLRFVSFFCCNDRLHTEAFQTIVLYHFSWSFTHWYFTSGLCIIIYWL